MIVVIDAATGKIAAGPEITARGFVEDDEIFATIMPKIERALAEATGNGVRDAVPAAAGHPPHHRQLGRRRRSVAGR